MVCTLAKILSVLVGFLVVSSCHTFAKDTNQTGVEQQARKIYIIGHRCAAGLAPENTLPAFEKACEFKVDAVELDVHLSADDRPGWPDLTSTISAARFRGP